MEHAPGAGGQPPQLRFSAPRASRLVLLLGASGVLALLLVGAMSAWTLRSNELRVAALDLRNLSKLLAGKVHLAVEQVDSALTGLANDLADTADERARQRDLDRSLARAAAPRHVLGFAVVSADGNTIATAGEASAPALAQALGTLVLPAAGDFRLRVAAPVQLPQSGRWAFALWRALAPNGSPSGMVVVALVDLRETARLLGAESLSPDIEIRLLRQDGAVLATHPWIDAAVGKTTSPLEAGKTEAMDGAAPVVVGSALVGDHPLLLTATMTRAAALRRWHGFALSLATALVLTALLILVFSVGVRWLARRGEHLADEMSAHRRRLLEAQQFAGLESWELDGAGNIRGLSPRAVRMLGGAGDGTSLHRDELLKAVIEEDRPRVGAALNWNAATDDAIEVEFTVDAVLDSRVFRIRSAAGASRAHASASMHGTLLDVTAQRRSELASRHLAALVESSDDAVISLSVDGVVLSWNGGAQRVFGHMASDTAGRPVTTVFPGDGGVAIARMLEVVARGAGIRSFESRQRTLAGDWIQVATTLSPIRDRHGTVIAASAISRNVTEQFRAQKRLALDQAVARILADSDTTDQALPNILERICLDMEWDCAAYQEVMSDGGSFRCRHVWGPQNAEIASFLSATRELTGRMRAHGWNGPTLENCTPSWVADITEFPGFKRREAALRAGLRGALGVPIVVDGKGVAVMEFFSGASRKPDEVFLQVCASFGRQIGQFLERRNAEAALRESEARFRELADLSSDWYWEQDETFRFTQISGGVIRLGGDPRSHLGRRRWELPLILPAGRTWDEHRAALQRHESFADLEYRQIDPHGVLRYVTESGRPVFDARGVFRGYRGTGRDLTARRRTEAQSAAQHAVTMVLAQAPDIRQAIPSIIEVVCRTFDWDCGLYRVLSEDGATVECPHMWAIEEQRIATFVSAISAPVALTSVGLFRRVLASAEPQWVEDLQLTPKAQIFHASTVHGIRGTFAIPLQTGGRMIGGLQFYSSRRIVPDAGLVEAAVATGRQIGQYIDRQRAEEAQKAADARLRGIAANIPGVVFEYRLSADGSASFDFVSDRALDLLEEAPGAFLADPRLFFSMVDRKSSARLLRSMRNSRATAGLWTSEVLVHTRSGRSKWVRGESMPKFLDDGAVVWDGVLLDVTAQKQAEQAIQQMNELLERRVDERTAELSAANRELESFAYSVSHDLRAPLRSIEGFSRLLAQEYAGTLDAQAADFIHRVRSAALRMSDLIEDMLKLSRVSRSELRRVRTDLTAIALSVAGELDGATPARKVQFTAHPGMSAMCDANLLRIVLENLLGNAYKFTSRKDRAIVEFGALHRRRKTVYYVRDNGAGFDPARADKLFGPFQRLHSANEFEGTGIGLATVKRIIARHGGRIWAESTVEQGATFYFTLSRESA